ncbi:MAG: PEGA domain-containing protein [Proteobacteria bacterium]|nr:PEGA domain-containing protein [Pseudomonadota bacterium]
MLSTPATFEAAKEDFGVLSIQSRPEGARVFINGEERGLTPVSVRGLPEGSHEVILYLAGYGAYRQTVDGQGGRIFVDLQSQQGLGVGLVSVITDPPDARVDVDGRRVGLSPLEIPLEVGRHTFHLSKAGHKDADETVAVEPEGRYTVKVALAPREGALLVISSPAGAEVLLNGASVGKAWEPLRVEDVTPGTYAVRVQKEGYRPWEKGDVQIRSAETATVLAALLPLRDYSWVRLFTEPPGARVWLDGQDLGAAGADGLGFKAAKGAHRLRLEADPLELPGYQPLQVTVNFTEDEVDYGKSPLRLPPVDPNFTQALALIDRGQKEEALSFLDRVAPDHPSYGEGRLIAVEVLRDLGRVAEVPRELGNLLSRPEHRNNPVLNTAFGYWSLVAARDAADPDAAKLLEGALEALDRAVQAVDLFPADQRDALVLKAHYFAGMASEVLFNLTGERKYVKKGSQAWEVFFARVDLSPRALEEPWIERARKHRRTLDFLAKKLGG